VVSSYIWCDSIKFSFKEMLITLIFAVDTIKIYFGEGRKELDGKEDDDTVPSCIISYTIIY